jgi:hypothetical protein
LPLIIVLVLCGCSFSAGKTETGTAEPVKVEPVANTLERRFAVPAGYERVAAGKHSFGEYLRTLLLKHHGARVKYYNGETKSRDVYEAVEYSKWRDGYRIVVRGNDAWWVKTAVYSTEHKDFRKYLDTVFAYAGTASLAREMVSVRLADMQIGDVFIQGGSPGHCVIVVDMAQNPETGEKIFMLAQSYMPAQDIHILKNPGNAALSPWYSVDFGEVLNTPEWTFQKGDLKRFK